MDLNVKQAPLVRYRQNQIQNCSGIDYVIFSRSNIFQNQPELKKGRRVLLK